MQANVGIARIVNSVGGFVSGYSPAIIATALGPLSRDFQLSPDENGFQTSSQQLKQGFLTSSILVGAMFGSIFGGILADKLGRKKTVIISAIVASAASIAVAFTPYFAAVCTLRVVLGLAVGIIGVVCPMYVSEVSPPEQRGALNTLFQVMLTLGILVSAVIGILMGMLPAQYQWQSMFALGAVPCLLLVVVGIYMDESELWLSKNSGENQYLINSVVGNEVANKEGCFALFSSRHIRKTFIAILLPTVQQLTGINTIIYYAIPTFKAAGLDSTLDQELATVAVFFWNFVSTLVAAAFVDRYGRRPLFLGGLTMMVISLFIIGGDYFFITARTTQSVLSIVFIFVFIFGFELGPGPLFNVICNEIFPGSVQESGVALANYFNWGWNLTISTLFPLLRGALANNNLSVGWLYIGFAGIGLVGMALLYFLLPETKGKAVDGPGRL